MATHAPACTRLHAPASPFRTLTLYRALRRVAGSGLDAVTVCEVFSGGVGIEQADGNEALIAAAPELHAAAAEVFGLIDAGFLTVGILAADDPARIATCGRAIDALEAVLTKTKTSGRAAS